METNCFVKFGEVFQYEEESESTFSSGLMRLTEVSSSNTMSKPARLPKILPNPISAILSYWGFHEFQRIERGPKAAGVAYRGELFQHLTYVGGIS